MSKRKQIRSHPGTPQPLPFIIYISSHAALCELGVVFESTPTNLKIEIKNRK